MTDSRSSKIVQLLKRYRKELILLIIGFALGSLLNGSGATNQDVAVEPSATEPQERLVATEDNVAEVQALQGTIGDLERSVATKEDSLVSASEDITDVQGDLAASRSELAETATDLSDAQTERDQALAETEQLQEDLTQLSENSVEQQTQIAVQADQIAALEAQAPVEAPPVPQQPVVAAPEAPPAPVAAPATASFANCTEARAAGAAPVRRGDPGYGPHLDRDDNGIGCE